jgi:catechol 2,3-dioxygenase-like lactoylglutathione lyase family enzyme
VNDSLGHAAGDEMLRTIAGRLQEALRAEDTAARPGGDEFAALLEDLDGEAAAHDVAERVRSAVERPVTIGDRELRPAAGIGIAFPQPRATADELLRNADLAMYAAKGRGKAQVTARTRTITAPPTSPAALARSATCAPAASPRRGPAPCPAAPTRCASPAARRSSLICVAEEKRMRLRGLHHVTAIVADMERTIGFYRDVLGLHIVRDGPSDDDPDSRHVWFATDGGGPGALVSFMQYPNLPEGVVGRNSVHHFALIVDSDDEQRAWRDYLRGRGLECSEVLDRGAFRSLYVRDPDGHIVEIATRGPGFGAGGPPA